MTSQIYKISCYQTFLDVVSSHITTADRDTEFLNCVYIKNTRTNQLRKLFIVQRH